MRRSFTLLELIVVIIVIAILATIALGNYIKITDRAKSAEGRHLLGMIRDSQMRYKAEKNAYATAMADLDLSYTAPKYFAVDDPAGTTAELGKVTATGGYVLRITEDGAINCTDGATTCKDAGLVAGDNTF